MISILFKLSKIFLLPQISAATLLLFLIFFYLRQGGPTDLLSDNVKTDHSICKQVKSFCIVTLKSVIGVVVPVSVKFTSAVS